MHGSTRRRLLTRSGWERRSKHRRSRTCLIGRSASSFNPAIYRTDLTDMLHGFPIFWNMKADALTAV